ncbi:MAG: hypothetical protein ChlgKO_13210 [Chlamydiales bacterium]
MFTTTSPALASFFSRMQKEVFVRNITKKEVIEKTQKIFSQFQDTLNAIENFSPTERTINNNKELLKEATTFKNNLLNKADEFVHNMSKIPPRSHNTQTKC